MKPLNWVRLIGMNSLSSMLKLLFRILPVLIALAVSSPNIMGQEVLEIEVEKPGKLSKHIKKDQYHQIKSLTIKGTLNNSDILILSQLSNLKKLNLAETEFENRDYHADKRPFVKSDKLDERIVNFPSLPNLRQMIVPNRYWDIDVKNLPNLKVVGMFGTPAVIGLTHRLDTLAINHESLSHIKHFRHASTSQGFNAKATVLLFDGGIDSWDKLTDIVDGVEANVYVLSNVRALKTWSKEITPEVLSSVYCILSGAYSNYPSEALTIPDGVKVIFHNAFSNPHLKNINLSNVEQIGSDAFDGCTNLSELIIPETVKTIGSEAFNNSGIKSLIIPSTIEKIKGNAFVGLDTVEFLGDYPPEIIVYTKPYSSVNVSGYSEHSDLAFDGIVYVPKGRFDAYNIGGYKKASIIEKGKENEYVFNVEKAGTLNNYITDKIANDIVSLTITGRLYDTDFDAIYKCKNLRNLDLSHCFIMESYETAKRKRDNDAALLGLLSTVASMANANEAAKFNAGIGNISDATYTDAASQFFSKTLKELESGEITPSDQCVFPEKPFDNNTNPYLKRIVFPVQMRKVPFICNAGILSELVLPPYAEEIPYRAFQFADIKKIQFPASIKILGDECFIGTDLESVDLSQTQVTTLHSVFKSCKNLKEFKGSRNLTDMHGSIGEKDVVGYFYTSEKPLGLNYSTFKTIHIPKGCKAGWSKGNNDVEIIDDIEL